MASTEKWSQAELIGRRSRLQAKMAEAGLDAIMVGDATNFQYLTGYTVSQFLHRMRPEIFLLPQRGDPVLYGYGVAGLREQSFIPTVKQYIDVPFPVEDLAALIKELGWEKATIGAELGTNQRLGLPVNDYFTLQALLPDVTWGDAGPLLLAVQMVKSADEIAELRRACEITQQVWETILTRLHPGDTLDDVRHQIAVATVELGGDTDMPVAAANLSHLTTGTHDGVLRKGDMFKSDFRSGHRGYLSDICRIATVGDPTSSHVESHKLAYQITMNCIAQVRPGIKARDIALFSNKQMRELGLKELNQNKRMGHGIGTEGTTPPSLNIVDDTELVPGMTIAVEPNFTNEFGLILVEEDVLVTDRGHELLSRGGEVLGMIS